MEFKIRELLALFIVAFSVSFSGCSYHEFKIFIPADNNYSVISKGSSKNSQLNLNKDILWKWASLEGNIKTFFEIQDRPLLPNLNIAMQNSSGKYINIEALAQDVSCARMPNKSLQCSVFNNENIKNIEITVCEVSCVSGEKHTKYRFKIESVGSFVAFDGP